MLVNFKRLSIQGYLSGYSKDWLETIEFSRKHGIKCMVEKFPMDKALEAYAHREKARFRAVVLPSMRQPATEVLKVRGNPKAGTMLLLTHGFCRSMRAEYLPANRSSCPQRLNTIMFGYSALARVGLVHGM